jgi:2'-5' RNA ligase
MRLFIAIETPKEIANYFSEVQKKLAGAKLTLTKNFHLTLKFLGEITPAQADEIKKRLGKIQFKPFTATLAGTGIFPSEQMIRVVWVGIEPHDIICSLQKQIDEALHGLFPKEKSFQPHITLARVKTVDNKKQFAEQIKNLKIEQLKFEVKEFKLVESKLTSEGSIYTTIADYPAKAL